MKKKELWLFEVAAILQLLWRVSLIVCVFVFFKANGLDLSTFAYCIAVKITLRWQIYVCNRMLLCFSTRPEQDLNLYPLWSFWWRSDWTLNPNWAPLLHFDTNVFNGCFFFFFSSVLVNIIFTPLLMLVCKIIILYTSSLYRSVKQETVLSLFNDFDTGIAVCKYNAENKKLVQKVLVYFFLFVCFLRSNGKSLKCAVRQIYYSLDVCCCLRATHWMLYCYIME